MTPSAFLCSLFPGSHSAQPRWVTGSGMGKGEGKSECHGDGNYQVQLLSRESSHKFLVVALSLYQSKVAPTRPRQTTDLPILLTYVLHTRKCTLHSFSVYHSMHLSTEYDVCCKFFFMDTLIRLRNYSSFLNSLNTFYYKRVLDFAK